MYEHVYSLEQLAAWSRDRILKFLKGKTRERQALGVKRLVSELNRIRKDYARDERFFHKKWETFLKRAKALEEEVKKLCVHPEAEIRLGRYQDEDTLGRLQPAQFRIYCLVCQTKFGEVPAEGT
jgi:hypothetical protein